ncbi:MAG: recombinase [Gammaproteobacteria bacterium RIFCSPHIGHO2_12_FULL_41_15]|nr:MAG: recombinase [Gammaproteobacteria bacterium RIFCSPHIGHO2_12_FULL_41_15]
MDQLPEKFPASRVLTETDNSYVHAATSENTRMAYQSDIKHFLSQGNELPATPETVECYLKACATEYNPRTLIRRVTALRQWHKLQGCEDPTQNPLVVKTLRGIARLHGRPKKQAIALRLEDLDRLVTHLKANGALKSTRNRALLLVGFFGAFRRSELVSLKWGQVSFLSDGMIITLPRSKTDQTGEGAPCVIPFGNETRCPVRALIDWRQASKQWDGFIFRRISKTGNLSQEAICAHHLNRLIKALVKEVGLLYADQYSSHSSRRGFATEAARLGASMPAIQRHGRWRSTKTVVEYVEAGRQFADSAVNVLFDFK